MPGADRPSQAWRQATYGWPEWVLAVILLAAFLVGGGLLSAALTAF